MFIEKNINITGLNISFIDNEKNNSKIILFMHGWGADKYNLMSIYKPLMDNYRIISVDLPGFGNSSRPEISIGSEEYCEIIYKFLVALNIKKINIVAHSFGGKLAILLAVNYSNFVEKLVLIDSSGIRAKRGFLWYIRVFSFKFLKFLYKNIFKNDRLLESLKNRFGSDDYKNAGKMRDILVKTVNEDFSHILDKIKCPVFLYWGEKDRDTPLWMARKMQKKINDCGMFIVKNGGHYSFLQDNRIVNIIKSFI
ncbi:MAG TPA: alpha/beta hydrolase [Spirochaetota bacterium]|nr:alpha/beta hydrolase [Spirochaetota bacterium]HOL57530.1 alpha/beta hydrolase [Spirochaetota bacterium]HPP05249.1 alpha/beta hydrolase [Spirochaetota bacterium]